MFRSRLEDIVPAEELLFEPTPGFGYYAPWLKHAVAHPAKMNTWLLEYLIRAFTEPCDTVLDPMAGSGNTGTVAALLGRNAVQVELERKFWEWMEKARENVEKTETATPKGRIVNICGDARRLSELLSQADVAITSPPYANIDPTAFTNRHIGNREEPRSEYVKQEGYSDNPANIGNLPLGTVDACITSPPYAETYTGGGDPEKRKQRLIKVGHDPKDFLGGKARNAVLKHYDEIDVCLTSPPYSEALSERAGGGSKKNIEGTGIVSDGKKQAQGAPKPYSTSKDNIGNLAHGSIDAVITSPPYKTEMRGSGLNKDDKGLGLGCKWNGYSANPHNIDDLPLGNVDAVITSPPYEGSLEGTTRHTRGGIASRDPALAQTGTYADVIVTSPPYENAVHCRGHSDYQEKLTSEKSLFMDEYGASNNNIGNLKSFDEEYQLLESNQNAEQFTTQQSITFGSGKSEKPTYLTEMLKVYGEMFKVLRAGGLAIIVVKPFVRNKKPVDLPYHTWLLMEKVGFRLAKLYKFRLPQFSFWRILQYRKHPDVPVIAHEYVLVCQKPDGYKASKVEPLINQFSFLFEAVCEENMQKIRKCNFL